MVSRVSCPRVVCCAARLEGIDSFTTDLFHPMILEGFFRLLNLGKTEAAAREQSRRRQEATKRGSSTTSDKPTIPQQGQRRVRRTLLPGGPMQRNESRSLVRGRPRRPRTGLSDQLVGIMGFWSVLIPIGIKSLVRVIVPRAQDVAWQSCTPTACIRMA